MNTASEPQYYALKIDVRPGTSDKDVHALLNGFVVNKEKKGLFRNPQGKLLEGAEIVEMADDPTEGFNDRYYALVAVDTRVSQDKAKTLVRSIGELLRCDERVRDVSAEPQTVTWSTFEAFVKSHGRSRK